MIGMLDLTTVCQCLSLLSSFGICGCGRMPLAYEFFSTWKHTKKELPPKQVCGNDQYGGIMIRKRLVRGSAWQQNIQNSFRGFCWNLLVNASPGIVHSMQCKLHWRCHTTRIHLVQWNQTLLAQGHRDVQGAPMCNHKKNQQNLDAGSIRMKHL